MNLELDTFRELPRNLDYYDCYWSAYYPKINECLNAVYKTRRKIDIKCHLGQHENYL